MNAAGAVPWPATPGSPCHAGDRLRRASAYARGTMEAGAPPGPAQRSHPASRAGQGTCKCGMPDTQQASPTWVHGRGGPMMTNSSTDRRRQARRRPVASRRGRCYLRRCASRHESGRRPWLVCAPRLAGEVVYAHRYGRCADHSHIITRRPRRCTPCSRRPVTVPHRYRGVRGMIQPCLTAGSADVAGPPTGNCSGSPSNPRLQSVALKALLRHHLLPLPWKATQAPPVRPVTCERRQRPGGAVPAQSSPSPRAASPGAAVPRPSASPAPGPTRTSSRLLESAPWLRPQSRGMSRHAQTRLCPGRVRLRAGRARCVHTGVRRSAIPAGGRGLSRWRATGTPSVHDGRRAGLAAARRRT